MQTRKIIFAALVSISSATWAYAYNNCTLPNAQAPTPPTRPICAQMHNCSNYEVFAYNSAVDSYRMAYNSYRQRYNMQVDAYNECIRQLKRRLESSQY